MIPTSLHKNISSKVLCMKPPNGWLGTQVNGVGCSGTLSVANRNHSQLTLFATCYRSRDHPPEESTPVWLWFPSQICQPLPPHGQRWSIHIAKPSLKNRGVFQALHQRENLSPLLVFFWASHRPGLSAAKQLVLVTSHDLVLLILFHPVNLFNTPHYLQPGR